MLILNVQVVYVLYQLIYALESISVVTVRRLDRRRYEEVLVILIVFLGVSLLEVIYYTVGYRALVVNILIFGVSLVGFTLVSRTSRRR